MTVPARNDDSEFELKFLRDLARTEGFAHASMRAMGMAEAATVFMSEIFGSAATARRLNEYLGHGAENTDVMVALPDHPMPDVLALARPPEFWAERFAAAGIRMAARTLREKAVKAGLCYYVDKNVLITPAQIDALMIWRGKQEAKSPSPKSARASREYQEVRRKLLAKRKT